MIIKGNVKHFQVFEGKEFDVQYVDVEITTGELYEIMEKKVLSLYDSGHVDNTTILSIEPEAE